MDERLTLLIKLRWIIYDDHCIARALEGFTTHFPTCAVHMQKQQKPTDASQVELSATTFGKIDPTALKLCRSVRALFTPASAVGALEMRLSIIGVI